MRNPKRESYNGWTELACKGVLLSQLRDERYATSEKKRKGRGRPRGHSKKKMKREQKVYGNVRAALTKIRAALAESSKDFNGLPFGTIVSTAPLQKKYPPWPG